MWIATERSTNDQPSEPDFRALFVEHSAAIYRVAYSVTGNREDAEDVLQIVFLKLMKRGYLTDEACENPAG